MSVTAFCRLNVDFLYSGLERMPNLGEEVLCQNFDIQLGGGATVIPIILGNLGIEAKLGTFLGKGIQSLIAEQLLNKLNFYNYYNFYTGDSSPVVITSVISMIHDRAFISHCDDMSDDLTDKFAPDNKIYEFMTGSKICFFTPAYPKVMEQLHDEGTFIIFDAGWNDIKDHNKFLNQIKNVDIYSPNAMEVIKITGASTIEEAVTKLSDYVKYPIVKNGAKGCIAYLNGKVIHIGMPCKFKAIDTTGAGDNFLAGIVYGLHNDLEIVDCLKMGNIFGGNSTTELGCYRANINLTKTRIDKYWKMYGTSRDAIRRP